MIYQNEIFKHEDFWLILPIRIGQKSHIIQVGVRCWCKTLKSSVRIRKGETLLSLLIIMNILFQKDISPLYHYCSLNMIGFSLQFWSLVYWWIFLKHISYFFILESKIVYQIDLKILNFILINRWYELNIQLKLKYLELYTSAMWDYTS